MNFSDLSFWIFVVCAVAFLAGVGWLIKSYRDAKYAAYFFLREEAALRVKRLMFVLVPLAVVVVFLGLRLFGDQEQVTPPPEGTVEVTEEAATKPATVTVTYTAAPVLTGTATSLAAVTEEVTGAATEAPVETSEVTATETAEPTEPVETTEPAEPTEPGEPETSTATLTATPGEPAGATEVIVTEEVAAAPTFTATVEAGVPVTPTMTVTATSPAAPAGTPVAPTEEITGTVEPSPTPTTTDTPVFSTVTPNPETRVGSITFSLGVTSNLQPDRPGTVFSPTEDYIYAFFGYNNMKNGVAWRHVWFRDSEELGSQGSLWEWGSDGRAYVFFAPVGGYTSGRYRVRVYVGDELKQSGSFVIR